jgi:hypothetical protein
MNRIRQISYFFRVLFQVLLVALPMLLITAWLNSAGEIILFGGAIDINFIPLAYYGKILHPLSNLEKLLAICTSILPMLIQLYILFSLIKLFKLYEIGKIFSINNVRYIRNIGYALLVTQIIEPIYQCVMGFVLTWRNPPGHRVASIFFDQTNIGMILIALIVILISWIMTEGCKLREEQQLTV